MYIHTIKELQTLDIQRKRKTIIGGLFFFVLVFCFVLFFENFWNFGLDTEFLLNTSFQESFLTCFFHLKFSKPCLISLKTHLYHFNPSLSFRLFSNLKNYYKHHCEDYPHIFIYVSFLEYLLSVILKELDF